MKKVAIDVNFLGKFPSNKRSHRKIKKGFDKCLLSWTIGGSKYIKEIQAMPSLTSYISQLARLNLVNYIQDSSRNLAIDDIQNLFEEIVKSANSNDHHLCALAYCESLDVIVTEDLDISNLRDKLRSSNQIKTSKLSFKIYNGQVSSSSVLGY